MRAERKQGIYINAIKNSEAAGNPSTKTHVNKEKKVQTCWCSNHQSGVCMLLAGDFHCACIKNWMNEL